MEVTVAKIDGNVNEMKAMLSQLMKRQMGKAEASDDEDMVGKENQQPTRAAAKARVAAAGASY